MPDDCFCGFYAISREDQAIPVRSHVNSPIPIGPDDRHLGIDPTDIIDDSLKLMVRKDTIRFCIVKAEIFCAVVMINGQQHNLLSQVARPCR